MTELIPIVVDSYLLDALNGIKNAAVRRRLMKEITMDMCSGGDGIYVEKITVDDKGTAIITVVDYKSENILIYDFCISENYPFTVPKIKVNNLGYIDFLRIKTNTFQQLLKRLTGKDCLCCHSFACGERWSPGIRITQIISEIRMIRKERRIIINKFFADKIKDMYLIADIDLDSWLGIEICKKN